MPSAKNNQITSPTLSGVFDTSDIMGHEVQTNRTGDQPPQTSRSSQIWVVTDQSGKVLLQDNKLKCLIYKKKNPGTHCTQLDKKRPSMEDNLNQAEMMAKSILDGNFIFIDLSRPTIMESIVANNDMYDVVSNALPNDVKGNQPLDPAILDKLTGAMQTLHPNIKVILINDDELNTGTVNDTIDSIVKNSDNLRLPPEFKNFDDVEKLNGQAFNTSLDKSDFYSDPEQSEDSEVLLDKEI